MVLFKLYHFPLPSTASEIGVRHTECEGPVEPFRHPADGDRQEKILQCQVNVDRIGDDSDRLDHQICAGIAGAGDGIQTDR